MDMLSGRLKILLDKAIDEFYTKDKYLIAPNDLKKKKKADNEKACVFRIAHYLQNWINKKTYLTAQGFVVDCEYNLKGELRGSKTRSDGKNTTPDLIIHQRGQNGRNVLLVEFKGYWHIPCEQNTHRGAWKDYEEIQDVVPYLHYDLGIFVKLNAENTNMAFFCNHKWKNNITPLDLFP
jgi:hypothetical protein